MFKYMHRISEDLDFLSYKPFSFIRLSSKMRKKFNIKKEEEYSNIKLPMTEENIRAREELREQVKALKK